MSRHALVNRDKRTFKITRVTIKASNSRLLVDLKQLCRTPAERDQTSAAHIRATRSSATHADQEGRRGVIHVPATNTMSLFLITRITRHHVARM